MTESRAPETSTVFHALAPKAVRCRREHCTGSLEPWGLYSPILSFFSNCIFFDINSVFKGCFLLIHPFPEDLSRWQALCWVPWGSRGE